MHWLQQHFHRHEQRPKWDYLWRITLESLAVAGLMGILAAAIGAESREIRPSQLPAFLVSAVACAPILETLVLQLVPIVIARGCGAARPVQLGVSMIAFAMPHFVVSPLTGLTAGLVGGFYFAFTFTRWHRESLLWAVCMTCAHHTLYNTCLALIVVVAMMLR